MNKNIKKFTAPAVIFVATCILILGSNWLALPAFGVLSLVGTLGFALACSAAAMVFLVALTAPVCLAFGLSQLGALLQTVFGTVSGALAIWILGMLLPGTVLLHGLVDALPYALVNTLMIWAIAGACGSLKRGLKLLPQRVVKPIK